MVLRWLAAHRPILIICLTLVAGGIDALGYFRLGHVFVANMTGNLVLAAVAVAEGHTVHAIRSLWALVGFMAGAAGASVVSDRRRVLWMISLEFIFLCGMTALFWRAQSLGVNAGFGAIAFGSLAMGVQSRLARHVNLAGTATTVVTSTLTQVVDDTVKFVAGGTPEGWGARLAVFLAYAVGAGLAALGRNHSVIVMATALAVVVGLALAVVRWWPAPGEGRR
jgi:uncharacterized membrane protein YoaK (UPF0700 family)